MVSLLYNIAINLKKGYRMDLIHCKQLALTYHQKNPAFPVGYSYGERITTEYEFDYILSSNQGKMVTNGTSVDLIPGMFFVRPPGTAVEGILDYTSWYLRFQTENDFLLPFSYCTLSLKLCHPIFQQIYDLHVRQPKDYQYLIDYHMNTLLFHLYQEGNRPEAISDRDNPLAKIYEEMQLSWNKNYSLDYYVEMSGYSKSRFCHLFQQLYKTSPIQFLHELRLQNVCYQLIETDKPVKELMIENGYSNEQSFFRSFKSYTGETPLSYRQKHRFR